MFEDIAESDQLEYFKLAYRQVTGQLLRKVRKAERPDFVCKRPDGSLVGVEFTLITRDPESASYASILGGVEYMDALDGVGAICETISRKGEKMAMKKRGMQDWQQLDSSILVLSTPDCPISEIENLLDKDMRKEVLETCVQSRFSEVWVADHTETEAFGRVELFGLFPEEYWGYHPNPSHGKPYG